MPTNPNEGSPDRATILRAIREVYSGPAWHGPSVRDTLRGVDAATAARRVAAGRNTIWELVLHLVYSRHRLIQRVEPKPIARLPRKLRKAWWPLPPADPSDAAWNADLNLLNEYQRRLLDSIARAPAARLKRVRGGQRRTVAHELLGLAIHDAYHAGQIRVEALALASAAKP
jgi:uncharacterized damage-inducible protein DinB